MMFNELIEAGSAGHKWPSLVDMMEAKGMFEDGDIMTILSAKQHDPKLGHDAIFGGNKV